MKPSLSSAWRRMTLLLVGIGASTLVAPASIIYVDQGATGANDGRLWEDAYTGLQSALAAAVDGDEIRVAEGTYKPTVGTSQTVYFNIGQEVRLYGGFPAGGGDFADRDPSAHPTILSGEINGAGASDNSLHVLVIDPFVATCVVDGFTITRGSANGSGNRGRGGGIFIENDAAPILRNLILTGNSAINDGGAVMVETGGTAVPVFENVIFDSNTSGDQGGAVYNWMRSPEYTTCVFSNNTAGRDGGAMFNNTSTSPITGCRFTGNQAVGSGGAIYNDASSVTIAGCDFANNRTVGTDAIGGNAVGGSASGGGIHHLSGNLTVTNCSFIDNHCEGGTGSGADTVQPFSNGTGGRALGGGLAHVGGTLVATSCLFSGNSAKGGTGEGGDYPLLGSDGTGTSGEALGGGLYTAGGDAASVINCSFSGNLALIGIASAFSSGTRVYTPCSGGAVAVDAGTLTLTNSILWDNRSQRGSPPATRLISETSGNFTGNSNIIASGSTLPTGTNPLFVNAGSDNLRLQPGSPAIGAGDNAAIPAGVTTDRDGKARVVPSQVDLGCFESDELNLRVSSIDLGDALTCNADCAGWLPGAAGLEATITLVGTAGDISFVRLPTLLPNGALDLELASGTSGSAWFEVELRDPSGTYRGMPVATFSINNVLPDPGDINPDVAFDLTATDAGPIGGGNATARVRGFLQPPGTRKGVVLAPSGFSTEVPTFNPPADDLADVKLDQFNKRFYAAGYDVYTIAWHDPRTYVDRNAMAVAEILALLAGAGLDRGDGTLDTLSPRERVIVFGASMGGLVSRFALCYLDTLATPYRCDLFISFDSPQEGAYIPIGLQYFAQWMNDLGNEHAAGFDNAELTSAIDAMDQPAPKQMLLLHHTRAHDTGNPSHAAERTTFVNTLRDTYGDWPSNPNLRMVAIANGAGDGLFEEFETTSGTTGKWAGAGSKPDDQYRILDWRSSTEEAFNEVQTPNYQDPLFGTTLWKAKFRVRATGRVDADAWGQRVSGSPIDVFVGVPTAIVYITDERSDGDGNWDIDDGSTTLDMGASDNSIRAEIREFIKDQLDLPGVVPDSWIDPVIDAMIDRFDDEILKLKDNAQTRKVSSGQMWDWVPGGLRDTGAGMVEALGSEGTLNYASNRHCFIPTVSALAISGTYSAGGDAIPNDAHLDSPFDALYHFGTFKNRTHLLNEPAWVTAVLDHELRVLSGEYRLQIRDDVQPSYFSWSGRSILEASDDLGSWTPLFERTNGIYRPPLPDPGTRFYRLRFPPAFTNDP